jgi:integrase
VIIQGLRMKNPFFSVFKKASRNYYQVSFKDKDGKYLPAISTKQRTEAAACQTAMDWLRDGIPAKQEALTVKQIELKELSRKIETAKEAKPILDDLKRRGIIKSYTLAGTDQAQNFADFLTGFWTWETSAYIQEKNRKEHGIHKLYCREMKTLGDKHWRPFFEGRFLGDMTQIDIDNFINHVGGLSYMAKGEIKPFSAAHKNIVIKAGVKPLRWAYSKGLIEKDITRGIMLYAGKAKERHILTPELAGAVFSVQWDNAKAKLANMLSMVTGMRHGEIMALQARDIGQDKIYVNHAYNHIDGLKTTKTNESRIVELPFKSIINDLLELAGRNPHGYSLDSFVFWNEASNNKPMDEQALIKGLRAALVKTGMSAEAAKQYTFHGWRHYFTTHMKPHLEKKLLKRETGHKTDIMLDHYSDHVIEGERQKIQQAQINVFGALLPVEAAPYIGKAG